MNSHKKQINAAYQISFYCNSQSAAMNPLTLNESEYLKIRETYKNHSFEVLMVLYANALVPVMLYVHM